MVKLIQQVGEYFTSKKRFYQQTISFNFSQCSTIGDGGLATLASLCDPTSVRVAPSGNVYISYFDHDVNAIRKVDTNGIISTSSNFLHSRQQSFDRQ